MSKAQQVREAVTAEIRKVPGIGATGSDWVHWADESRFPAAYTLLETCEKVPGPTRTKTVRARYRVAVCLNTGTPDDDFDTLMAAIETQLEDDPSLGGLVNDCYVAGCERFMTATEIAADRYVRSIWVDVEYYHPRGAP